MRCMCALDAEKHAEKSYKLGIPEEELFSYFPYCGGPISIFREKYT